MKQIHIRPRSWGKTTELIDRFMVEYFNECEAKHKRKNWFSTTSDHFSADEHKNISFFCVPNFHMKKFIFSEIKKRFFHWNSDNLSETKLNERIIVTKNVVENDAVFCMKFRGRRFNDVNFFVDEFLFEKQGTYDLYIKANHPSCNEINWSCYGTSDMLYNKNLVDLVKCCKKNDIPYNYLNIEDMIEDEDSDNFFK